MGLKQKQNNPNEFEDSVLSCLRDIHGEDIDAQEE